MTKPTDPKDREWMASTEGVRRLHFDRVDLHSQRPRRSPRSNPAASATSSANLACVLADSPLEHPLESNFDHGLSRKQIKRIRSGKLAIEARLDLHGYTQSAALSSLESFIAEALGLACRMVLIIHGKGYRSETEAKLRPLVLRWLAERDEVLAWCPAQPAHGGLGATYVYLRSIRTTR